MKQTNKTMLAVFFSMLLLFAGNLLAVDTAAMTLQGELISVNPDSHTFIVRDSQQNKVEFTYSEQTEISGASENIEGLAGDEGHTVTVYYTTEGSKKMATKVEVRPMQRSY